MPRVTRLKNRLTIQMRKYSPALPVNSGRTVRTEDAPGGPAVGLLPPERAADGVPASAMRGSPSPAGSLVGTAKAGDRNYRDRLRATSRASCLLFVYTCRHARHQRESA